MGEFEIGGFVDGEGEAFGQGGGLSPGAGGGFVIQGDGEVLQEVCEGGALLRGEAAAANAAKNACEGGAGALRSGTIRY